MQNDGNIYFSVKVLALIRRKENFKTTTMYQFQCNLIERQRKNITNDKHNVLLDYYILVLISVHQ